MTELRKIQDKLFQVHLHEMVGVQGEPTIDAETRDLINLKNRWGATHPGAKPPACLTWRAASTRHTFGRRLSAI